MTEPTKDFIRDTEALVVRLRKELVSAPPEHPVHPAVCDEAADALQGANAMIAAHASWIGRLMTVCNSHHELMVLMMRFQVAHYDRDSVSAVECYQRLAGRLAEMGCQWSMDMLEHPFPDMFDTPDVEA